MKQEQAKEWAKGLSDTELARLLESSFGLMFTEKPNLEAMVDEAAERLKGFGKRLRETYFKGLETNHF